MTDLYYQWNTELIGLDDIGIFEDSSIGEILNSITKNKVELTVNQNCLFLVKDNRVSFSQSLPCKPSNVDINVTDTKSTYTTAVASSSVIQEQACTVYIRSDMRLVRACAMGKRPSLPPRLIRASCWSRARRTVSIDLFQLRIIPAVWFGVYGIWIDLQFTCTEQTYS